MVNSRNKGASFERDCVKILRAELGDVVDAESLKRNLDQWRDGGTDIIVGELFAVERCAFVSAINHHSATHRLTISEGVTRPSVAFSILCKKIGSGN